MILVTSDTRRIAFKRLACIDTTYIFIEVPTWKSFCVTDSLNHWIADVEHPDSFVVKEAE